MRLLLDTHVLLALLSSDHRISPAARVAIDRPDTSLIVSAVSVWEVAIKRAIGKLKAPDDLLGVLDRTGVELLPITARHAHETANLPLHHRDPFDRLLVAQAQLEGCVLVSADRALASYEVPVLW